MAPRKSHGAAPSIPSLDLLKDTGSALLESKQLLLAFINKSPIYTFIKEVSPAESRVLAVSENYKEMLGIEAKDMLGKTMAELFPPEFAAKMTADDWQSVSSGEVLELEEELNGRSYSTIKFPIHFGDSIYLAGYTIDITERKQHEIAIQRANRALKTLSAGNESLIHATDEKQLLQKMCDVAVQVGGYRMAWIGYAREAAGKPIEQMAQAGLGADAPELPALSWEDRAGEVCPAAQAVIQGKVQIVADIARDAGNHPWCEHARKNGYASCIALPLQDGKKMIGVMMLFDSKADSFDDEEIKLLEEMAGDLAFGISTLRVRKEHLEHELRLQRNMFQTIEAISGIVEMRDPYTAGHQLRVANLARTIARQMGLPEERQELIHLASIVHDLGKISVPAEILSKPGSLNDVEFNLIKMHPKAGYDILKGIDFSGPLAQIVLQHHERMDGSGYPQGLKGEEILLEARILGLADVAEALSSHRPYRPALGEDAAMSEIIRGRGTLYDAQVVDACITLFKEKGYEFSQ